MKKYLIFFLFFEILVSCANENSTTDDTTKNKIYESSNKEDLFDKKFSCLNETKIFNGYSILISSSYNINNKDIAILALSKQQIVTLLLLEIIKDPNFSSNDGTVSYTYSGINGDDPLFLGNFFEVLDTLSIGKLQGKETFFFWNCRKDKIYDPEIFGLFNYENKRYITNPRKAWKIELIKGKIHEINTAEIDYYNGEYDVLPNPEN